MYLAPTLTIVCIKGVNRSPQVSDLWKCPNPIRTSVVIKDFIIFDRPLVLANFKHFRRCGHMEDDSMSDIAMCVCLCTSVTVRKHPACGEQFINVTSYDKYLDNFWTSKHFGHFWLAWEFELDGIPEISKFYTTRTWGTKCNRWRFCLTILGVVIILE